MSCRYNNYLHVTKRGRIKFNFRDENNIPLEPLEVPPEYSCALDLAARGGMSYVEIAEISGVSRQAIEQIVGRASASLAPGMSNWKDHKPWNEGAHEPLEPK